MKKQQKPIKKLELDELVTKVKNCLAWAKDPARAVVPGAESMTNDQV